MVKLTTLKVAKAKPGIYGDGDGLYLRVKPTGARSWVLRVQAEGRRRDVGLGSVNLLALDDRDARDALAAVPLMLRKSLTLEEARQKARTLRDMAKAGLNPIAERDRERKVIPTFAEAVDKAHEALGAGWAVKTADAFKASLVDHAVPKLGADKVDAITTKDVIAALAPIWTDKPQQARKVRHRILQVLAYAKAKGWRVQPVPEARELRAGGLSKQGKGGNFAAVPFKAVPEFFATELAKDGTASRLAMLFAISTAARSGEVRGATWEQVDLDAGTWSRPASLMKAGVAHVVSLNRAAVAVLEKAAPAGLRKGLIFPGMKAGKPLSDMSITKALRTAGRTETVHGFRSSFRDWAAEMMPTIPAMVAEMALAHSVGTATEQAYLRSDLRDLRRSLMDAWGQFVAPALYGDAANVVQLRTANSSSGG